ncbi:MAG TPA: type II toxin-antitoxin system RelE/ParE family toxin [Oligoflexia bacterium]|nr:type II toxin-antitoxin system RelE/ParE family toxin [Oligoflexia bacterium]HMP49283.1 type II toxin-antitoxin system RelE/ParE family toxin [Oligoflexia bacterium]
MSPRKKSSKTFSIYLTDRALSDLLEIENYSITNWGKAVAARYILKFEKAFRLLEDNADLARPNSELGTDLLFYRVEKHLLACVKIKTGLAVLTIAHASRDLEMLLGELSPTLRLEVKALVKKIQSSQ